MRVRTLVCVLGAFVPCVACSGGTVADDSASPFTVPTAIACADGAALRQRAADDRRRGEASSSNQEEVLLGSRANFVASLAVIADLECRSTRIDADDALKPALDAARTAEAATGFYEEARKWNEAAFMATEVLQALIQRLPASE